MSEKLIISKNAGKEAKYKALIPQIQALVSTEEDLIANLANVSAALHEAFGFLWVGFYLVKDEQLVLGPFQGPIACTRIHKGKGVCGTSWEKDEVMVVPDVNAFPGHIACSSSSQSEIVLPLRKEGVVIGVLDIDSSELNSFDEIDKQSLEQLLMAIGFA